MTARRELADCTVICGGWMNILLLLLADWKNLNFLSMMLIVLGQIIAIYLLKCDLIEKMVQTLSLTNCERAEDVPARLPACVTIAATINCLSLATGNPGGAGARS